MRYLEAKDCVFGTQSSTGCSEQNPGWLFASRPPVPLRSTYRHRADFHQDKEKKREDRGGMAARGISGSGWGGVEAGWKREDIENEKRTKSSHHGNGYSVGKIFHVGAVHCLEGPTALTERLPGKVRVPAGSRQAPAQRQEGAPRLSTDRRPQPPAPAPAASTSHGLPHRGPRGSSSVVRGCPLCVACPGPA